MKQYLFSIIYLLLLSGCSSLKLTPVDYSWPLEAVIKVDDNGFVREDRYSLKINVQNLFQEEFGVGVDFKGKTIRIIRNSIGTYFITAENFKNVYLFNQDLGSMSLVKKIAVSEVGLKNPFFNQRDTYIELVDENLKLNLTNEGIIGDKK